MEHIWKYFKIHNYAILGTYGNFLQHYFYKYRIVANIHHYILQIGVKNYSFPQTIFESDILFFKFKQSFFHIW